MNWCFQFTPLSTSHHSVEGRCAATPSLHYPAHVQALLLTASATAPTSSSKANIKKKRKRRRSAEPFFAVADTPRGQPSQLSLIRSSRCGAPSRNPLCALAVPLLHSPFSDMALFYPCADDYFEAARRRESTSWLSVKVRSCGPPFAIPSRTWVPLPHRRRPPLHPHLSCFHGETATPQFPTFAL